jgi:anti-sigma factor RsiW
MTHISEGDLRAWLDDELEAREMQMVSAHLQDCAECRGLKDELSARSRFVMSAIEELPSVRVPRPAVSAAWRWAVPALAVAACLTIVLLILPKRGTPMPPHSTQVAKAADTRVSATTHDPALDVPHPMAVRRAAAPRKAVSKPAPKLTEPEYFLALDNEPIETGVVVRVGTELGGFQADVIVGPDGRARAIRILTESD